MKILEHPSWKGWVLYLVMTIVLCIESYIFFFSIKNIIYVESLIFSNEIKLPSLPFLLYPLFYLFRSLLALFSLRTLYIFVFCTSGLDSFLTLPSLFSLSFYLLSFLTPRLTRVYFIPHFVLFFKLNAHFNICNA